MIIKRTSEKFPNAPSHTFCGRAHFLSRKCIGNTFNSKQPIDNVPLDASLLPKHPFFKYIYNYTPSPHFPQLNNFMYLFLNITKTHLPNTYISQNPMPKAKSTFSHANWHCPRQVCLYNLFPMLTKVLAFLFHEKSMQVFKWA